jgi:MoxR-like ATPase
MQEQSVTAGGKTRELKSPFFVFATQNPLEMEGTYPLPEAQIDRFFFKLKVDYPNFDELKEILIRTTGQILPETNSVIKGELLAELQQLVRRIPVATEVLEYAVKITIASQPQSENCTDLIKQYVNYGSSPRGAQALILAGKARAFLQGRFNVSFDDIKKVALPSLRHRILLNFEGEASDIEVEDIINQIVESVPESG